MLQLKGSICQLPHDVSELNDLEVGHPQLCKSAMHTGSLPTGDNCWKSLTAGMLTPANGVAVGSTAIAANRSWIRLSKFAPTILIPSTINVSSLLYLFRSVASFSADNVSDADAVINNMLCIVLPRTLYAAVPVGSSQINDDIIWTVAMLTQFTACHLHHRVYQVSLTNSGTATAVQEEQWNSVRLLLCPTPVQHKLEHLLLPLIKR